MKLFRHLPLFIATLLTAGIMGACNDDKGNTQIEPPIDTLNGMYIINQGNVASRLPASVTLYNFATGLATDPLQDAFEAANNGTPLGDTAMAAIIHNGYMFIAAYESDLVWIVDPVTLKIEKMMRFNQTQGHNPRHFTASGSRVFVSMFNGYVEVINTNTLEIEKEITVGPNPEGMAVANGRLYVANSDGMNWLGGYTQGCISIINLTDWTETRIQDLSQIFNPVKMCTDGQDIFTVCMGDYASIPATVKKISTADNSVTELCPGTELAIYGNSLYVINAPFGDPNPTYSRYDTNGNFTGVMASMQRGHDSWVDHAIGISVNSANGDIAILSYKKDPGTGYALFDDPGYVNLYAPDGTFKVRVQAGVCPNDVVFQN